MGEPFRLFKGRTNGYGGIDFQMIKFFQIVLHQSKAFDWIVIAVKEDPGVGGVIILGMKVFESVECEGRNHLGIPPGIQAVGMVRKEGLLGHLCKGVIG